MGSPKIGSSVLILLCLFGVSMVSATNTAANITDGSSEIVYSMYNTSTFSVEYPSDWDVGRSICTDAEGWEYHFDDVSGVTLSDPAFHSVSLIIGADQIVLYMTLSLDTLEAGSFDSSTQHFFDTLCFKNSNTVVTGDIPDMSHDLWVFLGRPVRKSVVTGDIPNMSYKQYDSVYFSVEHPQFWQVDKMQHATLGLMYNFMSGADLSAAINLGTVTDYNIDIIRVYLYVPRNSVGNGGFEDPAQHFLDTLHLKM